MLSIVLDANRSCVVPLQLASVERSSL